MCCGTSNYRTLSLIVGWLNVVISILAVFYYTYELVTSVQKPEENEESDESVESDFQPIFDNIVKQNYILLAYIPVTVFLIFVPSILLVKGIKQNRRKLIAPWLYIAYVSVAINSIFLISMIWITTRYSGSLGVGLISCIPLSLGLVFCVLCLYPVRKLYKSLSIPTPILPTQCVMLTEKPEDHLRYIPVFDN